jgi:hypothetical protein
MEVSQVLFVSAWKMMRHVEWQPPTTSRIHFCMHRHLARVSAASECCWLGWGLRKVRRIRPKDAIIARQMLL